MNKETLARAKELDKDIQEMEFALSYYKRGRWSHWGINDSASSFHFEFCKNWSYNPADMQDLPTWLNKPLMEVVERELERCKHELETLGSESEGNPDKTANELHESFVPADEEEQPKKKRPKMLSMFYALPLCVVFAVMLTCADVLVCKLLGWHCDIYSIIRSIAIAYVFFIISSLVEKI